MAGLRIEDQHRHLAPDAAGTVVGDLQGKDRGGGRISGVAAPFEHVDAGHDGPGPTGGHCTQIAGGLPPDVVVGAGHPWLLLARVTWVVT